MTSAARSARALPPVVIVRSIPLLNGQSGASRDGTFCGSWSYPRGVSRIFTTSFASVYPHYVTKVEKKGRTRSELHQVIEWLTGFDEAALEDHLASGTTFEDFFAAARLNPHAAQITGTVCGVRVEDVDDPLMQKIRYLDKLVDELAKGKPMQKVLRP